MVISSPEPPGPACCCTGPANTVPEAAVSNDGRAAPSPAPWITGQVHTPAGTVPQVSTRLHRRDLLGAWKARWGWGRMRYAVPPGLYAAGNPGGDSPVLVSANYKMSFDRLRAALAGLDAWILVLDTRGINVWCAAGKGTFGTEELVRRVLTSRLGEVVAHRTLILPQLGASGVAAHAVRRESGFRVVYGPVRAADLPAFLAAGNRATPAMRTVRFGLADRLAVVPVELVALIRPLALISAASLLLQAVPVVAGRLPAGALPGRTAAGLLPLLGAVAAGTVLVPVLLPYIPGRAFACKGWLAGLAWTGSYLLFLAPGTGSLNTAALLLLLPAVSAYLAMNFTGSTTFTSLSGVEKEIRLAAPPIYVFAGLGAVLFLVDFFLTL